MSTAAVRSVSPYPKATLAVAGALAAAIAAGALLSASTPRAPAPAYLVAAGRVEPAADGAGGPTSAVLYTPDGRNRLTITVEELPAASPASAPREAREGRVLHASSRP